MLAIIMNIENEEDRLFVEDIYIRYEKKMFCIAFDILHNKQDAEDCVHDTIERIIDKLERFKQADEIYLKKLIAITCRNIALNRYAKKREQNSMVISTTVYKEDDEDNIMDIPDRESDVQGMIISEENCAFLSSLINRLDLKYRDVIILKSMGLSTEEIASVMGISCELVRKRYSRARKMIIKLGGDALYERYGIR